MRNTSTVRKFLRRYALPPTALLFVATVLNVAVAWGTSLTPVQQAKSRFLVQTEFPARRIFRVQQLECTAGSRILWQSLGGYAGAESFIPPEKLPKQLWPDEFVLPDRARGVLADTRGWPMPALSAEAVFVNRSQRKQVTQHLIDVRGGFNIGPVSFSGPHEARFFPARPVWPGFLINTLLYAALALCFALALRILLAAHRRSRQSRHLCLTCGYPAGQSPRCTECGNLQLPFHSSGVA